MRGAGVGFREWISVRMKLEGRAPRSWIVRRPRSHELDACAVGLVVRRTSSRRGPSTFVVGRLASRRDPRAETAGEASASSSASFPCGAGARAVGFGLHRQVASGAIGRKSRWTGPGAGSTGCGGSSGLTTGSTRARRRGAPGRSPVRDDTARGLTQRRSRTGRRLPLIGTRLIRPVTQ